MFTEGDVRELVARAATLAVVKCLGNPYPAEFARVTSQVTREVMDSVSLRSLPSAQGTQPQFHECEGRLCTVCAEWRARHNLTKYGGCAD